MKLRISLSGEVDLPDEWDSTNAISDLLLAHGVWAIFGPGEAFSMVPDRVTIQEI